ncbi:MULTISPECIES: tail protein X [Symbiopectobacterium]|uniref:tail protein X n=1 Tax=Symbiopectobacterium TaxID=801 RepID=UPI001A2A2B39|nr:MULTISPECIES: tail protein X [Symbiopectobacterium]MBG6247337.1 phage tail protein [Candidatus Symbiopectobacterium sp. PLON1]MBT9429509.1 tail protein X [Candidatus Symbiopectobacterium endolongispinus]
MIVNALQGDTVDLLCYRHYGTSQGVTEQVIAANPGLSRQIFLNAGQAVMLPDIARKAEQETVQLWD